MVIRQREQLRNVRHGFTLMEILVVVAIIVILAGLGGYYILGAADNARKSSAKLKAQEIGKAVQSYSLDHNGNFPGNIQQLLTRDQLSKCPYLNNQDALIDPWGNAYQYDQSGPMNNGMEPDIFCISPQGQKFGNWSQSLQQQ